MNTNTHIRIAHLLRALFAIITLVAGTTQASGQTAREKALRDIETHRAWVETHVPVADTLDDEQLIMAAIDAVVSTCREDKYVELIRQAGRRFGKNDLEKYAELRASGAIDRGDSLGNICLDRLYEQALATCGSPSYTATFAAMQAWNNASSEKSIAHRADIFAEEAEKLYQSDACDKNKEIWLLGRWAKLFRLVNEENPLNYEPCKRLMAETFKFGHDYQGNPTVRSLLYFLSYNKAAYGFSSFPTYYAHINIKLDADSILNLRKCDVIPGNTARDSISGLDLLDLEFTTLKEKCHTAHPDLIMKEADFLQEAYRNRGTAYDEAAYLNRLKEILEFQTAYYPSRAVSFMTRNTIRQYEVNKILEGEKGSLLFHAKKYENEWEDAKTMVPESERVEPLLNYLVEEFGRQIVCDRDNTLAIVEEMQKLYEEGLRDNPLKKLNYQLLTAVLERQGEPAYQGTFKRITNEYLELCQTEAPSWETVSLGKLMMGYASTYFGDVPTWLTLERSILLQLQKLIGKDSPIFCYEYINYCNQAIHTNLPVLTLEGEENKQALIDDMLACCTPDPNISAPAYLCAAMFFASKSEHAKADLYFKKILVLADTQPEAQQFNTRIYCYTGLLQSAMNRGCSNDTIDTYGEALAAYAKQISGEIAQNYLWTLTTMANYYLNRDRYEEGKAWLEHCLTLYESPYMDTMDGTYIDIVNLLVRYYYIIESDLDKCLELAETAEAKIGAFKDLANYESYIRLLRIVYDLIEQKTPYDDVMLNKYWNLLNTTIQNYSVASNNPDVWFNHKLYLYIKHVGKAITAPQRRANAKASHTLEQFEKEWEAYKKEIVETTIPDLLNAKAYLEANHREKTTYYTQIAYCLATAYDKVTGETEKAEEYYKTCAASQNGEAITALINFYLAHGRYAEALTTCKQLEELWNTYLPSSSSDSRDLSNPARLYYGICFATHYLAEDYTGALQHARDYHSSTWSYISKNFDLFTQNERETFLNTYSAGGAGLKMLLPIYPDQISGEVYDCMLQEKGLLLRSAERVRRSIYASGDRELIHSLDSINRLMQQISLLEKDKLATQDGQAELISLREKLDRLERFAARKSEPYRTDDEVPSWTEVRDNLKKGEAAVEYVVSDSATMALVITPRCKQPQYVRLIGTDDMSRITQQLTSGKFNAVAIDFYEDDTEQLYTKLWQPMEKYFDGAKHIYFSPSAYLNSLAFAAFKVSDSEYLIDRYELHQLTTTAQLTRRDKKRKENRSAAVYGSIFYNDSQAREYQPLLEQLAQEAPKPDPEKTRAAARTEPFIFLKSTPYELNNIRKSFSQSKISATIQEGKTPTEEEFRKNDGRSPGILHISTHGFYYATPDEAAAIPYFRKFSNLYPMNTSGLALSGAEAAWKGTDLPLENDNILTSNEISALNLEDTRLVVLSACETALGAVNNDGVFGLPRGFKLAGVRSVCASLWSVNDVSTSSLMQSFYNHWLSEGNSMQTAIKRAMLEQRAKTPAPYYWAPFVMLDADI